MKVRSILNYKGGVGKTTLTACTAQALAITGFRVLAIDNDPQHNLTYILGCEAGRPNIRDIYHGSIGVASQNLFKAIKNTNISHLSLIPSSNDLCANDIKDPYLLKKCFEYSGLDRFFDYILIDNSPGLDVLQESSIHASNEIFVPTELSQYAINGICEMRDILDKKFPDDCSITKIIPNFYKNTKLQDAAIMELEYFFPNIITKTAIPFDSVFDILVKERKILFLHRLSSKVSAYYIKLIHELFDLDVEKTWQMVMEKKKEHVSNEARKRFFEHRPDLKKKKASTINENQEVLNDIKETNKCSNEFNQSNQPLLLLNGPVDTNPSGPS